jgi:glutamate--cysteine ligase catalytic subunit
MVESTPESPYSGTISSLLSVEKDMRRRRQLAKSYLKPNEVAITLTSYPRLGVQDVFTDPPTDPAGAKSSHSMFLAEDIINPHPRYR